MRRGELRNCPECRRPWPKGAEHDLRGFGWLDDLPRHVSPSNIDCLIHDGYGGRDRFLVIETKRPGEALQAGQRMLLEAQARQPRTLVYVLTGDLSHLTAERIGEGASSIQTSPEAFRAAVADWLRGEPFRLREVAGPDPRACVHQYLNDNGWRCIRCGAEWRAA